MDDEVLIRLTLPPRRTEFKNCWESNAEITSGIDKLGIRVLKVPKGDVETVVQLLRRRPEILLAEPNYYVYADDTFPNTLVRGVNMVWPIFALLRGGIYPLVRAGSPLR